MPQSWANAVIARQIIASATSIAANIAEGHGRYTIGAHRNHLSIAKGSTAETDSWLDLMHRDGLLTTEDEQQLHGICLELMTMLTAKIRTLEQLEQNIGKQAREARESYNLEAESIEELTPYSIEDYIP
jgi:four helix bundle protein